MENKYEEIYKFAVMSDGTEISEMTVTVSGTKQFHELLMGGKSLSKMQYPIL